MKTKTKRISAIFLLFFLGFWALLGGYGFIGSPDGASLQIPLEYLQDSPFQDYLIPGIILFLAIGVSSIVIGIGVIRKIRNYPFFIMFQGVVLILWLTAQLFLNTAFYTPYLHIPCYTIGALLVVLGVVIKVENGQPKKAMKH